MPKSVLPPPGADLSALRDLWMLTNPSDPMEAVRADWATILKGNRLDLVDLALACFPADLPEDRPAMDRRRLMVGYLSLLEGSAKAGHATITLRLLQAVETHTFPGWTAIESWHHEAIQAALSKKHFHVVAQILALAEPDRRAMLCAHPLNRGDAATFETLVRLVPEPMTEAQWDRCAKALATHDHTPDAPHIYLGLLARFQGRLARQDLVPWLVGNLSAHAQKTRDGTVWDVRPNVPALACLLGPLPSTTRETLLSHAIRQLNVTDRASVAATLAELAHPLRARDRQADLQHRPQVASAANRRRI